MIVTYLNMLQTKKQSKFVNAFLDVLLIIILGAPTILTTCLTILNGTSRMQNLMSILNQIQKVFYFNLLAIHNELSFNVTRVITRNLDYKI